MLSNVTKNFREKTVPPRTPGALRSALREAAAECKRLASAIEKENSLDKREALEGEFRAAEADFNRAEAEFDSDHKTRQREAEAVFADDAKVGKPATGRRFFQMFPHLEIDRAGWESGEEFLSCVKNGLYDSRLIQATMGEGTGAGGGFAVPSEFASTWLDVSLESEVVRPRAKVYPMKTDVLRVPSFDWSTNSGSVAGGLIVRWVTEGSAISETEPTLRQVKLLAKKAALLTSVSSEAVADGINLETQLGAAMVAALGFAMDSAFLTGDGLGKPVGALKSASLITVPKESGQAADSVTYSNLVTAFSRLHPSCVPGSIWVCHPSTIPQLTQLSVTIGTSGQHIPVLQNAADGSWQILTRPVVFSEKLPVLGDAGDILLADFSRYLVGIRSEIALESSRHVHFTKDATCLRGILRVDGMAEWATAITPVSGSSLSWAVCIAAR